LPRGGGGGQFSFQPVAPPLRTALPPPTPTMAVPAIDEAPVATHMLMMAVRALLAMGKPGSTWVGGFRVAIHWNASKQAAYYAVHPPGATGSQGAIRSWRSMQSYGRANPSMSLAARGVLASESVQLDQGCDPANDGVRGTPEAAAPARRTGRAPPTRARGPRRPPRQPPRRPPRRPPRQPPSG